MTRADNAAKVIAHAQPTEARVLYLVSRMRGRLDALETAIASQDDRARFRVLVESDDLFRELFLTASEASS